MTFRPMIDNGLLSRSGRVSKRGKQASDQRVRRELFSDGLIQSRCEQPTEKEIDLRWAKEFRRLAKDGVKPRAYLKEALRLEAKWRER